MHKLCPPLFVLAMAFQLQSVLAFDPACEGEQFKQIDSLSELPTKISQLLGAERNDRNGIADRNMPFNRTDVITNEVPMRRFAFAAVGESCGLIAVERGGRGYFVEVIEFVRGLEGWRQVGRYSIGRIPKSVSEIKGSTGG